MSGKHTVAKTQADSKSMHFHSKFLYIHVSSEGIFTKTFPLLYKFGDIFRMFHL